MRAISLGFLFLILGACSANAPAPDVQAGAQVGPTEPVKAEDQSEDQSDQAEDADMRLVAEAEGKTEMVCRREKPIGSNVGRRVCRPKGAAAESSENDKAILRQVQELSDESRQVTGE